MRSRVTAKCWPTSSSVCSDPVVPRPKRILITFSSRGVSVARTSSAISRRFDATTASEGFRIDLSSMKSPRCESSSSPIGVSSEIGSCAILRTLRTFETGMSIFLAISSLVGSRPSSCTSEEIAKKMDIPVSKVRKVLKIAQEPISLETPIGEEEDSHLGDFIEDKSILNPSDAVVASNLREITDEVLATLTPREEKVIKMRFGLGTTGSEHTLEEVGQHFAVTRERIRQIEAKALRKLRHPSRSRKLKAFLETVQHG